MRNLNYILIAIVCLFASPIHAGEAVTDSISAQATVQTVYFEGGSTLDLGNVKEGEIVTGKLTLVNASETELVIHDVYTGCGCVRAKYPETIAAGEKGEIELIFNSNRYKGAVLRAIKIRTNGTPRILRAHLKAFIS